jgi:hypothetical protein
MREKKTTNYYKVKYSLFFISLILIFIVNLNFISASEPVISTLASSNINPYSATLNGRISYMGDYDMLNVTFQFCNVVVGCEWTPIQYITGEGVFSQTITGLTPLTTYSYKVGWFESEGIFGGAGTERNLTTTSGIQSGNTITNLSTIAQQSSFYWGYTLYKPQKTYNLINDYVFFNNYDYSTSEYNPFLQDFSFNSQTEYPIYSGTSNLFNINEYGGLTDDYLGGSSSISADGNYIALTGDYGDILYIYEKSGSTWVKVYEEDFELTTDWEITDLHFTRNGVHLILSIYDKFMDSNFIAVTDVGNWSEISTSWIEYLGETDEEVSYVKEIQSNDNILAISYVFDLGTEQVYFYDINTPNFDSLDFTITFSGLDNPKSKRNIHFSNDNNYLMILLTTGLNKSISQVYNIYNENEIVQNLDWYHALNTNSAIFGDSNLTSKNKTCIDISYDSKYFILGVEDSIYFISLSNNTANNKILLYEDFDNDDWVLDCVVSSDSSKILYTTFSTANFSAKSDNNGNGYSILFMNNNLSINYLPTIFTLPVSDVTTTGIKLNGRLTSLEGYDNVNAFFEIHISNTFGFNASYITDVVQLTNIGDFSEDLNYQYFPFDNLIDNQVLWLNAEYYTYRAVLEINGQYIYGELLNEDYENENIHLTNDTIDTEMEGQESVFKEVSKISGLFPDADGLTTRTKFFYVILTIAIISIVLLLVGGGINGVNPLMLYIVAFIDALLFFLFVAIGYIPVVMVIMVLMGLIAIVYLKFKGGG